MSQPQLTQFYKPRKKFQNDTKRSLLETGESDPVGDTNLELSSLLSRWGLPQTVAEQYREIGVTHLFPWQADCLHTDNCLQGGSLVFSAPSSAGKMLVAEILMMKRVFETRKKALVVLPYVALAKETLLRLQSLLRDTWIKVDGHIGNPPFGEPNDIVVATIENANSLVNRMMKEKVLLNLTCVVVDELHELGDSSRGFLLELLLSKILFSAGPSVQVIKAQSKEVNLKTGFQVIGIGTLPNIGELSRWLRASHYTTNFRPVPLTELVKVGDHLYTTQGVEVRSVKPLLQLPSNLIWLCLETILQGHSVLVFCPSLSSAENLAVAVSEALLSLDKPDPNDSDPVRKIRTELKSTRTRLKEVSLSIHFVYSDGVQVCQQLQTGEPDDAQGRERWVGVHCHHAGLTFEERDRVERAFKLGVVRVLIATTTLSSGVNLPARRVIMTRWMSLYKQMAGRAGRKGIDREGESILLCEKKEDVDRVNREERVASCLLFPGAITGAMKRAILEVIVYGAASTREDLAR